MTLHPSRADIAKVRRLAKHVEWCQCELLRHAGELPGPSHSGLSVADLQCIAAEASRHAFVVAIASQVK
jgi:hypothetical protein